MGRYVSHTKVKNHQTSNSRDKGKETPFDTNVTFQPSLRLPADGLETPATPANTALVSDQTTSSDIGAATEAMKSFAAAQLNITEEADGATLHCVSISQLCFKHGRITVPPGIVLAASGFSAPPLPSSEGSTQGYSHSNPPPHYPHAQALLSWGANRKYREFMRGGWRDVPEAERWWVHALGGAVEEQRKANVEGLGGVADGNGPMGLLRRGMDGAKSV